jgi:hypothetical protein
MTSDDLEYVLRKYFLPSFSSLIVGAVLGFGIAHLTMTQLNRSVMQQLGQLSETAMQAERAFKAYKQGDDKQLKALEVLAQSDSIAFMFMSNLKHHQGDIKGADDLLLYAVRHYNDVHLRLALTASKYAFESGKPAAPEDEKVTQLDSQTRQQLGLCHQALTDRYSRWGYYSVMYELLFDTRSCKASV